MGFACSVPAKPAALYMSAPKEAFATAAMSMHGICFHNLGLKAAADYHGLQTSWNLLEQLFISLKFRQALITGVPGFPSHPGQRLKEGSGLMRPSTCQRISVPGRSCKKGT